MMGYVIRAVDDNVPVPLPMELVLTCDGPHQSMPSRFSEPWDGANLDDLLRAAARAGWAIRVGDDALTLCKFCKAIYDRDRSRQKRPEPERPSQLDIFGGTG